MYHKLYQLYIIEKFLFQEFWLYFSSYKKQDDMIFKYL